MLLITALRVTHLSSQWFQSIVKNRPPYDENVSDLDSINDIRNGMIVQANFHMGLDSGLLAILKVFHSSLPGSS